MSTRRRSICLAGLAALANPLRAVGQAKGPKVFRIGFLGPVSASAYETRVAAFRAGLREQGFIEGKTIIVEYRWAEGQYERLPALAQELVRLKVDLIVTTSTPAARAAKAATGTIPVVIANVADPLASSLVASLARPGGNITGLANRVGDTTEKQLDLLVATLPRLARAGILLNPENESMRGLVEGIEVASRRVQLSLVRAEARTPAEIKQAFALIVEQRVEALVVLAEPLFFTHRVLITALAAKARVPAIYNDPQYVDSGGLMSYGADIDEIHRQAAGYVSKILNGAKPGELPVEQPNKMNLTINLRAAQALAITIPQSVLLRADRIIH